MEANRKWKSVVNSSLAGTRAGVPALFQLISVASLARMGNQPPCPLREPLETGVDTHTAILKYISALPSLTDTENLPGPLYLWSGRTLCLEEKIAESHGLIRWCQGELDQIIFDDLEPDFDPSPHLPPHVLHFMPQGLVLTVADASFTQSILLDEGACLLEPVVREWRHTPHPDAWATPPLDVQELWNSGAIAASRRQLPCTNPLACTAYNLQGKTLGAMLADLPRPPGMPRVWPLAPTRVLCVFLRVLLPAVAPSPQDEYWLSIYVLLSRLRSFDDLLLCLHRPIFWKVGPHASLRSS